MSGDCSVMADTLELEKSVGQVGNAAVLKVIADVADAELGKRMDLDWC